MAGLVTVAFPPEQVCVELVVYPQTQLWFTLCVPPPVAEVPEKDSEHDKVLDEPAKHRVQYIPTWWVPFPLLE